MTLRIDEIVAYNVKAIRMQKKMTQQALADITKLSKQTISNIEKGQGVTSKTLERIAECLEVSPLVFYQEISDREDIQFKRVSTTNNVKFNTDLYIGEINTIVNKIVLNTKDIIYYQKLLPIIKDTFINNMDIVLDKLNTEKSDKNYHVLLAFEENILINVKQAIFDEEEMDELIEEEE